MTDLTARRKELLNARYTGKRVCDPRNGRTGTVSQVHLYYMWGRLWWASGLHLVVKMDAGGAWIARLSEVRFL